MESMMLARWEFIIALVILLNLLNFIWLKHVRYKRTIARRKHRWKRWLSITLFILAPIVFILNLIPTIQAHLFNILLGTNGTWFGLSQLKFINKHSGVPPIVEPLSIFYVIISSLLFLLGVLKIK